jgi:membrane associated rhomboid family serine protease
MCFTPPIPVAADRPLTIVPKVTYFFLGVNAAVWVFLQILLLGPIFGLFPATALKALLNTVGYVDQLRWPWTYLTYSVVQVGLMHLLGNLVFFWMFGCFVEERLGRVRYTLLLLAGAVVACLGHSWALAEWGSASHRGEALIGSSGVVAAILGAAVVLDPQLRYRFFMMFMVKPVTFYMEAALYIPIWAILQVLSLRGSGVSSGVSYAAHVAGLVVGVGVGLAVRLIPRSKKSVERELRAEQAQEDEQTQIDYRSFQKALAEGSTEAARALYTRTSKGLDPLPARPAEEILLARQLFKRSEPFGAATILRELISRGGREDEQLAASLLLAEILLVAERDLEGAKRLLRVLHQGYKEHPRYGDVLRLIERVKETERNLFKRPQ